MIFEHEIPSGSKLYFGKSARVKRDIEYLASKALDNLGFEEILTPLFSYHQHEFFDDKKPLIRVSDEENYEVSLRADSTADIVRIVRKRLGRSTVSKKWFYIQPIVNFPTKEQYQIGAEILEGTFEEVVRTSTTLLAQMGLSSVMQISNIRIPYLLNKKYGISLEALKNMHIENIMSEDLLWIKDLVHIGKASDLEDISVFPEDIQVELIKIKEAVLSVNYDNIVISPLYYTKMRYYDSLTFRIFEENSLLAMGGIYTIDDVEASGFALYTDECVRSKMSKEEDLV